MRPQKGRNNVRQRATARSIATDMALLTLCYRFTKENAQKTYYGSGVPVAPVQPSLVEFGQYCGVLSHVPIRV